MAADAVLTPVDPVGLVAVPVLAALADFAVAAGVPVLAVVPDLAAVAEVPVLAVVDGLGAAAEVVVLGFALSDGAAGVAVVCALAASALAANNRIRVLDFITVLDSSLLLEGSLSGQDRFFAIQTNLSSISPE
jgi:hypothetical protein